MSFLKYTASSAYSFSIAFSIVFLHLVTKDSSPILFIIVSVFIAIIWFNFINYRRLMRLYAIFFKQFKSIIIINLIIAVQWTATFYGSKYAIPFKFLLVGFIMPVVISNTNLLATNKKQCFYLIINFIMCLLIILTMHNFIGITCALLVGCLSYSYRKYSHKMMNKYSLSKLDILCIRNYGLLALSLLGYYTFKPHAAVILPSFSILALIPFITFIIPTYLNQYGIEQVGAERHSIIASLTPTIAILLSLLLGVKNIDLFSILLSSIIGIIFIFENLFW